MPQTKEHVLLAAGRRAAIVVYLNKVDLVDDPIAGAGRDEVRDLLSKYEFQRPRRRSSRRAKKAWREIRKRKRRSSN